MRRLLEISAVAALLTGGCSSMNVASQPSGLPLRYHNARYDFTFYLPARWRGYSSLVQQWEGVAYSPVTDSLVAVGHGQMITLRHPGWRPDAPYQDIPILVFARAQWDALHRGELWPSLFAGGVMDELWHNQKYVFAMSSRYNADDEVEARKEAANIVEWNQSANGMPRLYPQ